MRGIFNMSMKRRSFLFGILLTIPYFDQVWASSFHIPSNINNLTEIEKTTISYRFGLEGLEPKTLSQISALTGYTAMGIQKAEKRALVKLQNNELFKELLT